MKKLSEDLINFFQNQGYVLVSTVDQEGSVHCACKGIVKMDTSGQVYLLDLYLGKTCRNLKANPRISIAAIEEHKFTGYCLKGKARIIPGEKVSPEIMAAWEGRITSRLTQRLLRNIREEKGHPAHPEVMLPQPKYMIAMRVEEIVDLTRGHLKQKG